MRIGLETEVQKTNVLDLRNLAIPERNFQIATVFETLFPNNSFVLVSDSDPERFHRYLQAEFGERMGWKILDQGPDIWRILITKIR